MDLIRPHDNMLKYSYVHRTHFIVFIYHPIISMHFVIFILIFLHMLYHVSVSLSEVTDHRLYFNNLRQGPDNVRLKLICGHFLYTIISPKNGCIPYRYKDDM